MQTYHIQIQTLKSSTYIINCQYTFSTTFSIIYRSLNVSLIDKKFWIKSYYVAFDDNNFLVPCLTLNPPQTIIYKPVEDLMVIMESQI